MPQDWFPLDSNLGTKPEVQRVIDRIGESGHVADVIGPLVLLWGLVDQHAVPITTDVVDEFDGLLPDYSRRMVARTCGGGESLWLTIERETGWVKFDESGVLIKGFVRRFGVSSKARSRAALRQQLHRSRESSVTDVTTSVTSALPEERERKGEDRTNTGPVREATSFAEAAAETVSELLPGPARPGSVARDDWKTWEELSELHRSFEFKATKTFSGKVTLALKIENLSDVASWLLWQAAEPRPLLPATEAALTMLVAVVLAKRVAAPKNPASAVVTLVTNKATNKLGMAVDRASEWADARSKLGAARELVEKLLRPTASQPESTAADPEKQDAAKELAALNERHGPTLDAMGKEALIQLAQTASDVARPMLLRSIDRGNLKGVRMTLLRLLAQRTAS